MDRVGKHNERVNKKKVKLISFLSFLMGVGGSSLVYVISNYLKESVGEENVGILYLLTYLVLFLALLNFHKLINRFGKIRIFFVLQFVKILVLASLGFLSISSLSTILIIGYLMLSYITWVEMDVILESFSIDRLSGRIRGIYLALNSLGYLVGPLISTQLLDNFGYSSVFFFGVILNVVFFIVTLLSFRMIKSEIREVPDVKNLLRKIFINKDIAGIYLVSVVLEVFYAMMIIYMPIYLLFQGIGWTQIGLILSLIHIPFILLQYPAGVMADKKTGEKEMIILALLLMSFSTGYIYFMESHNLIAWLVVLMITRVGASIVEILRDSYFYKKVDAQDIDLINFFRTAGPIAFVLGTILSSILLLFFPMKSIFLLTGIFMFLGIIPALILTDNLSEKEVMIKNNAKLANNNFGFWKSLEKKFIEGRVIKNRRF